MVGEKKRNLAPYIFASVLIIIGIVCLLAAITYLTTPHNEEKPNGGYVILIPHSTTVILKPLTGEGNVTDTQMELARSILEARFQVYDNTSSAHSFRFDDGNASVNVNYFNLTETQAETIATTPGAFEMRIRLNGSQSVYVLNSTDIKNVSYPGYEMKNGVQVWGVTFSLTDAGAQKLRQACIDTGATNDPTSHPMILLIDNQIVYSQPLSQSLADRIKNTTVNDLGALTGTGEDGKALAKRLSACMRSGTMPVNVEIRHYPTVSPQAIGASGP